MNAHTHTITHTQRTHMHITRGTHNHSTHIHNHTHTYTMYNHVCTTTCTHKTIHVQSHAQSHMYTQSHIHTVTRTHTQLFRSIAIYIKASHSQQPQQFKSSLSSAVAFLLSTLRSQFMLSLVHFMHLMPNLPVSLGMSPVLNLAAATLPGSVLAWGLTEPNTS
jgi:hypothetical protein